MVAVSAPVQDISGANRTVWPSSEAFDKRDIDYPQCILAARMDWAVALDLGKVLDRRALLAHFRAEPTVVYGL